MTKFTIELTKRQVREIEKICVLNHRKRGESVLAQPRWNGLGNGSLQCAILPNDLCKKIIRLREAAEKEEKYEPRIRKNI